MAMKNKAIITKYVTEASIRLLPSKSGVAKKQLGDLLQFPQMSHTATCLKLNLHLIPTLKSPYIF